MRSASASVGPAAEPLPSPVLGLVLVAMVVLIAATHPSYFIEDGLPMTVAGRQAYAAFLRTGVLANA